MTPLSKHSSSGVCLLYLNASPFGGALNNASTYSSPVLLPRHPRRHCLPFPEYHEVDIIIGKAIVSSTSISLSFLFCLSHR